MKHREAPLEDALKVILDPDILERLAPDIIENYGTIYDVPFYLANYYGAYNGGEIVGLLAELDGLHHLYVPKKHRKLSKKILHLFEEYHELHFWPTEYRDAKFFAIQNGYKLKDREYVKWVS